MSTKKMLIDATHAEETRVVVLASNVLEDYDVEAESRRLLKGNIYLAKVIRVEPSLQAAFVDYGGNRHGFLAFSEIHPDYYQIPVADREALMAEHEVAEQADEEKTADESAAQAAEVETVGGDDIDEVKVRRPFFPLRAYKIQEVIKRRQILLVQVVKEERGNKGAALTTYLSLAGRYCVLMPNSARGGGVSRKISNAAERKKLKKMLGELGLPKGMAVIVRTAGSKRSKAEIKRDYEYLIRLWDNIRELTLKSTAPELIHEEGSLIKRTLRDLYNNDIGEIIIDGDEGCQAAKSFMKLMIPSHAKKIQLYKDKTVSLFQHFQVESQLDAIHNPVVQLKSGAYIVINPTEALVSIDVNSGRSTRERNIEEMALKTNLEAVDEIARQVRLRDLSGLLVIDFIDMESSRNDAEVERRLKHAMRNDRARIQVGRISPFGLLEFSRQRLRPSIIETTSEPCPYCEGSGVRRSTDSAALFVLRAIEEEAAKRRAKEISVHAATAVALYILNHKRASLSDIESRNDIAVRIVNDDSLIPPECRIEQVKPRPGVSGAEPETPDSAEKKADENGEGKEDSRRRRRPRRHKRGGVEGSAEHEALAAGQLPETGEGPARSEGEKIAAPAADGALPLTPKRRRRGRRGGRRRSGRQFDAKAGTFLPAGDAALGAPSGVIMDQPPRESARESAKESARESARESHEAVNHYHREGKSESRPAMTETVPGEDSSAAIPEAGSGEVSSPAIESAKTTVINIDKDLSPPSNGKPKKGWWRRS